MSSDVLARITCGHCSNSPATHVLVVWWGAPVCKRLAKPVCEPCGIYSLEMAPRVAGEVHLYPADFSTPQQEEANAEH